MALDPRIALMGRSVEVPDAVVRRGQRAHALLMEQQAEEAKREAEAQAQAAQIIAREGGINDRSAAALVGAGSGKLGIDAYKAVGGRKLDEAQAGAANALGTYRGAQTTEQQQKTKFEAQNQPNVEALARANASIAGQRSGDLPARGDLASQFSLRGAQEATANANKAVAEKRAASILDYQQFREAFQQANPGADEMSAQYAYSRKGQPPPKQTPGIDIPLSPEVLAQKQQLAAAGRAPRAAAGGGGSATPGGNNLAKMVANYGLKMETALARMPSGSREALAGQVMELNPSYDPNMFASRNKTAVDFSPGGASGKALTAADTALAHLNTVEELGKALKNGDIQKLNQLFNFIGDQFGQAPPNNFRTAVRMVAPEITKVVVGGQTSATDRKEMEEGFSANASDEKTLGAVKTAARLLAERVKKQKHAYKSQMGKDLDREFSPESKAILERYGGGPERDFNATKYEKVAVGPNGHKIGLKGSKLYDVDTGQEVKQ